MSERPKLTAVRGKPRRINQKFSTSSVAVKRKIEEEPSTSKKFCKRLPEKPVKTFSAQERLNKIRHKIQNEGCSRKEIIKAVLDDSVNESTVSETCDPSENLMDWDSNCNMFPNSEKPCISDTENDEVDFNKDLKVCLIVDTNVLLSHLGKLEELLTVKKLEGKVFIFVPWMVLEELDNFKVKNKYMTLKNKATNAIHFINEELKKPSPRVIGQTVLEMAEQQSVGLNPDDKILSCCLQVKTKFDRVMLLTSDVNLKNKALLSNFTICSPTDFLTKVTGQYQNTTKYETIISKLGLICTMVICQCVKDAFGPIWIKMGDFTSPPWSFQECLYKFKKYWRTVFQDKMLKHFMNTVGDLIPVLKNKNICDDSEEYTKFMKLSLNLLIYLKDVQECQKEVQEAIQEIVKIG